MSFLLFFLNEIRAQGFHARFAFFWWKIETKNLKLLNVYSLHAISINFIIMLCSKKFQFCSCIVFLPFFKSLEICIRYKTEKEYFWFYCQRSLFSFFLSKNSMWIFLMQNVQKCWRILAFRYSCKTKSAIPYTPLGSSYDEHFRVSLP